MKNKLTILVCIFTLLIISGCGIKRNKAIEPSQIVYIIKDQLYDIGYKEYFHSNTYCVYDSYGNVYKIKSDEEVDSIIDEFLVGNLNDSWEKVATYDIGGLKAQYETIQRVCSKKQLVLDEGAYGEQIAIPTQSSSLYTHITWYAFYYDDRNNLKYQIIHISKLPGDYYADDEEINDVYELIKENFIKDLYK